ncbi:MAG: D-alanyl-D-alanine carboxypeptidase [Defluviitaleaceae bacterium]|nr:D-alanyl-D-alanine carboxypeptidase [Defluviitaleaceae bacterium]
MRKIFIAFAFLLVLATPIPVAVHAFVPVAAEAAILIDQNTGNILFAQNEHQQMFPAGLTKMLTALVVLDYLELQQVITVGTEIHSVPTGAIMSGHQVGESITVHNLLRGLMIRNGNDSGVVLALNTIRAERNNNNVPLVNAIQIFSDLMNEKAADLGARGTNFVNPNGLHHEQHYTTAYDLALIAQAFMQNPVLREIAQTVEFTGHGLYGYLGNPEEHGTLVEHNWVDTNELMSGGSFHYEYATGIRSGTTPQASDNVAASAERDSVQLIAIVLNAPDPTRWQDARILFEYGFSTFEYFDILQTNEYIETIFVTNAMLGGPTTLEVLASEDFTILLNQEQLAALERTIIFYDELLATAENMQNAYEPPYFIRLLDSDEPEETLGLTALMAPITENTPLGRIIFTLDGETLFDGEIRAATTIEERSLDSDMDFYIALFTGAVFSADAMPFWLGAAGVLIGIIGICIAVSERRRSKRSWYGGGRRRRYD